MDRAMGYVIGGLAIALLAIGLGFVVYGNGDRAGYARAVTDYKAGVLDCVIKLHYPDKVDK